MKKKFGKIIVLSLCVVVLGSCGTKKAASDPSSKKEAKTTQSSKAEPVETVFTGEMSGIQADWSVTHAGNQVLSTKITFPLTWEAAHIDPSQKDQLDMSGFLEEILKSFQEKYKTTEGVSLSHEWNDAGALISATIDFSKMSPEALSSFAGKEVKSQKDLDYSSMKAGMRLYKFKEKKQ